MNSTQQLPADKPGPSVTALVVVHGILCLILLYMLLFVVPVFGGMFADLGAALPRSTQLVLDIAAWMRTHAVIMLPPLAMLCFGDVQLYLWLHRSKGRKTGLAWFAVVAIILFLMIPVTVISMFQPIFVMSELVSSVPNSSKRTPESIDNSRENGGKKQDQSDGDVR